MASSLPTWDDIQLNYPSSSGRKEKKNILYSNSPKRENRNFIVLKDTEDRKGTKNLEKYIDDINRNRNQNLPVSDMSSLNSKHNDGK